MKITMEIEKSERDGSPGMCARGVPFGSGWQRMLSEKAVPEDSHEWPAGRNVACRRGKGIDLSRTCSACASEPSLYYFLTEGFSDSLLNQVASCSWTGMAVRI